MTVNNVNTGDTEGIWYLKVFILLNEQEYCLKDYSGSSLDPYWMLWSLNVIVTLLNTDLDAKSFCETIDKFTYSKVQKSETISKIYFL